MNPLLDKKLTIDIDKFEQELKAQELSLSEDQWMSIIVSLKRSELQSLKSQPNGEQE